jgi:hypothetical protein
MQVGVFRTTLDAEKGRMTRTAITKRPAPHGLGALAPIVPAPWLIRLPDFAGFPGADVMTNTAGAASIGSADLDTPAQER